ncbi:DUF7410 domain-containing protein [Natronomonas sp. EA1]|uniref:DUF7410 domain-containing protein n=1 Tax=Natronomonas sp. EA1 TaxID=3421655 RepID=UPI003EBFDAD0
MLEHHPADPEDTDGPHDCPYCDRRFAERDWRDLHLGIDHEHRLTPGEADAYADALEGEEADLRLFRYKAIGALVVLYFGFLLLYAFQL